MPSRKPIAASSLQFRDLRTTGVSAHGDAGGVQTLQVERVEVSELKLETAFGHLSAASGVLSKVTLRLRAAAPGGALAERIVGFRIGELRLQRAGVEHLAVPSGPSRGPRKSWRVEPLGSLDGTLHADIKDAAWIFDAHVTVPVTAGRLDFNRATVEHVGPDSSMGISRMGVYVDAPNGRNYLYLLSATRVPGATFERRGALLSRSSDRGALELQPFAECFLSAGPLGAPASGARDMLARTSMRAEFRLGDGAIGDARSGVVLAGRAQGRNRVELSAVPGAGVVLRMLELDATQLHAELVGMKVAAQRLSGTLSVQAKGFPTETDLSVNIGELLLHDIVGGDAPDGPAQPG